MSCLVLEKFNVCCGAQKGNDELLSYRGGKHRKLQPGGM